MYWSFVATRTIRYIEHNSIVSLWSDDGSILLGDRRGEDLVQTLDGNVAMEIRCGCVCVVPMSCVSDFIEFVYLEKGVAYDGCCR